MLPRHRTTARSIILILVLLGVCTGTAQAAVPKQLVFPVVGKVTFQDDFGAPRSGHRHQGNDIMAERWSPVVAVEPGRVVHPSWGSADCLLILHGRSGTDYWYLHLNDDVTHGDDNRARNCRVGVAFTPGFRSGMRVRAGQLIGFVGNSGNAAGIHPHLHFELHPGGGRAVSPYRWLKNGQRLLYAVPGNVTSIRLALFGNYKGAETSLSLRVGRVAASTGWKAPAVPRPVQLKEGDGMTVERMSDTGKITPAFLAKATVGERITVWTPFFKPTLQTQLAPPDILAALKVRLRGEP
jgi:peptidase M23-like protein